MWFRRNAITLPLVFCGALFAGACSSSSTTSGSGPSSNLPTATATGDSAIAAAPVDFSKPGPYVVGTRNVPITDETCPAPPDVKFGCPRSAVMYYPADATSAASVTKLTGYSTSVAFPEQLRAVVPAAFLQEIQFGIDVFEAPMANKEGPFPILLQSHGFGSYYLFESRYMAHVASWGFVVAAPDHQERSLAGQLTPSSGFNPDADVTDLRNTLDVVKRANVDDTPLRGAIDTARVGVSGHSAGGSAAMRFGTDPAIATVIGKAPSAPVQFPESARRGGADAATMGSLVRQGLESVTPPTKPVLLIAADKDGAIALTSVEAEFEWLRSPKRLVVLENAGHNAFTDLCGPIRSQGGLMQYADKLPALVGLFRLGEDGCTEGMTDVAKSEAVINHATVAHLRHVFGMDPSEASLDAAFLQKAFPAAVARVDRT